MLEIERKFLVSATGADSLVRRASHHVELEQGYLCEGPPLVRVRILHGEGAVLTLKGPKTGLSCFEVEYPIPLDEGLALLGMCRHRLQKTRYFVPLKGSKTGYLELDVFHGAAEGLVVAEIELNSADDVLDLPPELGEEVSTKQEFSNLALSRREAAQRHPG